MLPRCALFGSPQSKTDSDEIPAQVVSVQGGVSADAAARLARVAAAATTMGAAVA